MEDNTVYVHSDNGYLKVLKDTLEVRFNLLIDNPESARKMRTICDVMHQFGLLSNNEYFIYTAQISSFYEYTVNMCE